MHVYPPDQIPQKTFRLTDDSTLTDGLQLLAHRLSPIATIMDVVVWLLLLNVLSLYYSKQMYIPSRVRNASMLEEAFILRGIIL